MNIALSKLAETVKGVIHRKGEEVLQAILPSKTHHVIQLRLSPAQELLYQVYLEVSNCFATHAPICAAFDSHVDLQCTCVIALKALIYEKGSMIVDAALLQSCCCGRKPVIPHSMCAFYQHVLLPLQARDGISSLLTPALAPWKLQTIQAQDALVQVCGCKSLFVDRLNLNMLCDLPATFMNRLEEIAGRASADGAGDTPMTDAAGSRGEALEGADLETPRGPPPDADFDDLMDAPAAIKSGRRGESITAST